MGGDAVKRTVLLAMLVLLMTSANAFPQLPTEFYGNITTRGQPADGTVTASAAGMDCATFTIRDTGHFGLLTCPLDDPDTAEVEGIPAGTTVGFSYNGEPAVVVSGDNTTAVGGFKHVVLSHPVPACGDGFCDPHFEDAASCVADCFLTNETNATGGGSSGGSSEGGGSGGGAGGGGAGGGAGGSAGGGEGGGGGGGGAVPGLVGALQGVAGVTGQYGCQEEWSCAEWTECTIEGLQERTCKDGNACGTTREKPPEIQACEYVPSCNDNMRNGDETGLDCGGSLCDPCPGCSNGIQDPGETGVDCGGDCRPCDSCFDGVQNYGETGVDCGGPCPSCVERKPPVLEYPALVCEKPLNPLRNDAKWFLLIVAVLAGLRVWLYGKEMRKIRKDQLLDEFKRSVRYFDRRREMLLFLLVVLAICLLSYVYYYEFLLCEVGHRYLWLYLLLLFLVPLIVFAVLRYVTYSDGRKLRAMKTHKRTHEEFLKDLVTFENEQIVEIEKDLAARMGELAADDRFVRELDRFPELKSIYEDVLRLHEEYHANKTPTGIEKQLCDQVYEIETNDAFRELASKEPEIDVIYRKLALLYRHYEEKQKLYDEMEGEQAEGEESDAATDSEKAGQ